MCLEDNPVMPSPTIDSPFTRDGAGNNLDFSQITLTDGIMR